MQQLLQFFTSVILVVLSWETHRNILNYERILYQAAKIFNRLKTVA